MIAGCTAIALQGRERRHTRAFFDPTLHRPEVEPEREGRIRVGARSQGLEANPRDAFAGDLGRSFDFVFVALPDGPRRGFHLAGQGVGRLLAEQLPDQRLVGTEPLAHALERERQRELLERRIDRRRRPQSLHEGR